MCELKRETTAAARVSHGMIDGISPRLDLEAQLIWLIVGMIRVVSRDPNSLLLTQVTSPDISTCSPYDIRALT